MSLYDVVVLGHVLTVILGFGGHGASAFVMFRVRAERDRARLATLLELSGSSIMFTSILLLVTIVLGIAAAIMGDHFAKFWPWAAISVLIVVIGLMTPLAGIPMNNVRRTLGMTTQGDKKGDPPRVPGTDEELAAVLARVRPELPAAIGIGGIAILVWLMEVKPF